MTSWSARLEEVLDGFDEWRVADDAARSVDDFGQLAERVRAVTGPRLGDVRRGLLAHGATDRTPQLGVQVVDVQPGVPHLEVLLAGEVAHRRAIGRDEVEHDGAALLRAVPVVPSCDREARCEPLDVPFPGTGCGLVEVVDVEDQPAFGGSEDTEVHQVRVTAGLHSKAGCRRPREVRRHDERRTAIERERRHEHPPVADRHELGDPGGSLALQQRDRIRSGVVHGQLGVARTGYERRASLPIATRSATVGCATVGVSASITAALAAPRLAATIHSSVQCTMRCWHTVVTTQVARTHQEPSERSNHPVWVRVLWRASRKMGR
jgi:hypothetical protein